MAEQAHDCWYPAEARRPTESFPDGDIGTCMKEGAAVGTIVMFRGSTSPATIQVDAEELWLPAKAQLLCMCATAWKPSVYDGATRRRKSGRRDRLRFLQKITSRQLPSSGASGAEENTAVAHPVRV